MAGAGEQAEAAGGGASGPETLASIGSGLTQLISTLQGADVTPSSQAVVAVTARLTALAKLLSQWTAIKTSGLQSLNEKLKVAGLGPVVMLEPK